MTLIELIKKLQSIAARNPNLADTEVYISDDDYGPLPVKMVGITHDRSRLVISDSGSGLDEDP